jgi:hypothetical protein
MRHTEDMLPVDVRFNTVLDEMHDEVMDVTQETIAVNNDILNPINEFSRNPERLWALSRHLADVMKSESEDGSVVQGAMYRGICFALQVVDDIKSTPIRKIAFSDVLTIQETSLADELIASTSEYIVGRARIDELLVQFMSELDPTNLYSHHVETAALLIFMLCERESGEEYLQQVANQLQPDDFRSE